MDANCRKTWTIYLSLLSSFPSFLDKDECMNKTHNCDVNAVCNNTDGSYNCACKHGYSGDGRKCIGN